MSCRVHGGSCRIPWGWDLAHTDSPRPYTLDELAGRTDCPHRYAYASAGDYLEGWHLWRALRRDGRPTSAEWRGVEEVIEAHLLEKIRTS